MSFRIEKDSLGEKKVPKDAYFGIQTLRAVENFPISNLKADPILIKAYAILKKACALANAELKLLTAKKAKAIIKATDEVISEKFNDQFLVDVFQAGAGTSFNMNVNEVIANRANEILGYEKGSYREINPNDDVNMAQSTNDTFPTATRLAILLKLQNFYQALQKLSKTFKAKGKTFDKIIKSARTHLQDAVPIRLGQEFTAYGTTLQKCLKDIQKNADDLTELGIGGTAAGTGINTHPKYRFLVVKYLRSMPLQTHYHAFAKLKNSQDLIEIMQSQQAINHISSSIKNLAVELYRISSDLRLLASGPNTGFAEINLPAVQPGSSIMPGKVNPSILECMNQVCCHVIGADQSINLAVLSGQLDLNVYMPLMAYEILNSIEILNNAIQMVEEKCIKGITANQKICEKYIMQSPSLVTALNPIIGYAASAEIAKEFIKTGKPIKEIILKKGILTEKQLEKILDVKKLTEPTLIYKVL